MNNKKNSPTHEKDGHAVDVIYQIKGRAQKLYPRRAVALVLIVLLLAVVPLTLIVDDARAQIVGPIACNSAAEGKLIYNDDFKVVQFCNGTDWIAMAGDTGGGSGGGGPITAGFPDIIFCSGSQGTSVFQYSYYDTSVSPNQHFYMIVGDQGSGSGGTNAYLTFRNNNGNQYTYHDGVTNNWDGWMNDCNGKSIATLTADGQTYNYNAGTGSGGGGTSVPTGAVMAFDLASCPAGWSPLTGASGRVIVGSGTLGPDTYTLNDTGGSARHILTIAEMPAHNHNVDPPSTNTSTAGAHTHSVPFGASSVAGNNSGSSIYRELSTGNRATSTAGNHNHSVNIPAFNSGSRGGGGAHENRQPYLALLYCRKD